MFFLHLNELNELNITMVDPEHNARAAAAAAAPVPVPAVPAVPVPEPEPEQDDVVRPANVWDEYERITHEWNQRPQVQERYTTRIRMINNTPGYHTGNQILHIRSIQMYNAADWNALFGAEQLDPLLREYAQASIEYAQDETGTVPFAGNMEVSLIMQQNYRRDIHRAIFMVHLTPHRRFYDGHIIQKEFSEGSRTHQTINRLFDTNTRAVVLQATQYQFLEYLADYDEALEVISDYFMDTDPDFTSMRFSYVEDDDNHGHYVVNPNAIDDHRLHCCAVDDDNPEAAAAAAVAAVAAHYPVFRPQPQQQQQPPAVIAIPPPPPVHDFGEIYRRNLEHNNIIYDEDEDEYYYPIQG